METNVIVGDVKVKHKLDFTTDDVRAKIKGDREESIPVKSSQNTSEETIDQNNVNCDIRKNTPDNDINQNSAKEDAHTDIVKYSMVENTKFETSNSDLGTEKERTNNKSVRAVNGVNDITGLFETFSVNDESKNLEKSDINHESENVDTATSSKEAGKHSETQKRNRLSSCLSDLDLIQTSTSVVPDVEVELQGSGSNELNRIGETALNPSECNAEFTLNYEAADLSANSSIESNKDEVPVCEKMKGIDMVKRENGSEKIPSRKRSDWSGSDSGNENKTDENDRKEPDIQDVFGVRQLKHVERPVDQTSALNGLDSSTSGDDDDVYIAKSLPELAQVFEPGDLKPKRHTRKIDGSKSPNPN